MSHYPSITFVRLEDTLFGGAENFLRRLTQELDQRDIAYTTLHSHAPGWLASWLKVLYFNREAKKHKGCQFYVSLARIDSADIYRAGDGVHRVFMQKLGKSFFSNPLHIITCWLEKRCFKKAKAIIANSEFIKQQIIKTYHIPEQKIHVVYNGITLPEPIDEHQAKQRLAREFNIDPEQKIILFVGTDFKRKGADICLDLLSHLQHADYHVFFVGKDKTLQRYQHLAQQLGLDEHVTFTGQRQDINVFYQAADILLFTPRYEPFSNVVLEAIANQCVAITSDQNGAHEILPVDCVLHENNQQDIINLIDILLQNNNKLTQYKQYCFDIAKQYSIKRSVDETLNVIQETMQ